MRAHEDWLLTAQRVAVHVPTGTAVLADLHLGYAAARRRCGEAIPTMPVHEALRPLAVVLSRLRLSRVVIAGDLFEDGVDDVAAGDLVSWLAAREAELVVVPGNHDRRLGKRLAGIAVAKDGVVLGPWLVVHGDRPLPPGPVVLGHFHPCVQIATFSRPCFLVGEDRLVLPAFSGDARGVAVGGDRRWRGLRCLVPVGEDVLDFGPIPGPRTRRRA
jgi:putative SbcD/Mre11-related phosphoesterase